MVGTILDAILDFKIKKPDIKILFLNGQDSNEYLALVLNFRKQDDSKSYLQYAPFSISRISDPTVIRKLQVDN